MRIILISGKAEAGKTTAAKFLKQKLEWQGKKVAIIPYGQYLKDTCKMLFDWDGNKDEKGRELLQHFGTDVVRKNNPAFWVDTVIRLSFHIGDIFDYLIVDDCRFKNEITTWYNFYRPDNIMAVRINRPGHENALTEEQRNHISETDLDDYIFDVTISAEDLEELEYCICEQILPKIDGGCRKAFRNFNWC